jgi:ABC-type Mn2+/Zn2+ transport system ATPase subunit
MLKSDAKLTERIIHVKGRKYKQLIIYMPRSLATDSAFPFKPKEMVRISISGKLLTVEKAELPYNETDMNEEKNVV